MSLDFTGYGVSVTFIGENGEKTSTGFSKAGPGCSYHAAFLEAVNEPSFNEFINSTNSMYGEFDIKVTYLAHTAMPR